MSEEMKIGMYTENEIFEYMTGCEGSMLGRSMYDAIFDKIHSLITENQQLKEQLENASKNYTKYIQERDNVLDEIREYINARCLEKDGLVGYGDDLSPIELMEILDKVKE